MKYIETNYSTDCRGWANYQTWIIGQWMKRCGDHAYWLNEARLCKFAAMSDQRIEEWELPVPTIALLILADQMRSEVAAQIPAILGSAFSGLLRAALREVHWPQLSAHFLNLD